MESNDTYMKDYEEELDGIKLGFTIIAFLIIMIILLCIFIEYGSEIKISEESSIIIDHYWPK